MIDQKLFFIIKNQLMVFDPGQIKDNGCSGFMRDYSLLVAFLQRDLKFCFVVGTACYLNFYNRQLVKLIDNTFYVYYILMIYANFANIEVHKLWACFVRGGTANAEIYLSALIQGTFYVYFNTLFYKLFLCLLFSLSLPPPLSFSLF